MEDVLEVYHRPYDARFPQVCMDEGSKQLLADKREGEPMEPGKPARYDNEYERKGTISVFVACEPLGGKRMITVSKRRTKKEWACFMRELIDVHYPDAEKLVLVMDNLNTHSPSSFYEVFRSAGSTSLNRKIRDPLHAQTRQLAQHGRNRAQCAGSPMLGWAHSQL